MARRREPEPEEHEVIVKPKVYTLRYDGYFQDFSITDHPNRTMAQASWDENEYEDARLIVEAPWDLTRMSPAWRRDLWNILAPDGEPAKEAPQYPDARALFERIDYWYRSNN